MVPGDTRIGYKSAPEFDPKGLGLVTSEVSGGWQVVSYLRRNWGGKGRRLRGREGEQWETYQ